MWRWLWVALSIAAITWLEFRFFPGHTYLHSDSQVFVPMLERLAAPAFLSRDFVATSPHLVFTAYDEITLLLYKVFHQDFQTMLTAQQLICRCSAVLGIFLIASSTGLPDFAALLVAGVVNLGAALPGAAVSLTELEAVPHGLAFSLCVLALGLLAAGKPLLSGVAGGVALLYHPPLAAALWLTAGICLVLDRKLRHLLRPMLTTLFVFLLLLANLAQLQPGVTDAQTFFKTVSASWLSIQRERTPEVLVSTWSGRTVAFYLLVFVAGAVASTRTWSSLNRQCKWFGTTLLFGGLLSLPLSGILLEVCRWSLIPQIQPARALLFTAVLSLTASGIAAARSFVEGRKIETAIWCTFILLVSLGTQASRFRGPETPRPSIEAVAAWAHQNTWGGSMFLFPDAGRDDYPGIFRAESIRAVYVDWNGGELAKYFENFAKDWDVRWNTTMTGGFSPRRLQDLLTLPIDYYVLRRTNALSRVQPAFSTKDFVVYERHDLKNAGTPLQLISAGGH